MIAQVDSLTTNVTELFGPMKAKADGGRRARAEAEHEGKLVVALDHGYFLDILANLRLWEEPDQRVQDVRNAIDSVDAQLVGPEDEVDWHGDFDTAAGAE